MSNRTPRPSTAHHKARVPVPPELRHAVAVLATNIGRRVVLETLRISQDVYNDLTMPGGQLRAEVLVRVQRAVDEAKGGGEFSSQPNGN